MTIKDAYLLGESPVFELLPGEGKEVNLKLEKNNLDEKIIILLLVLIINIKCECECVKRCSKCKETSCQKNLFLPKEKKRTLRKKK